jgi:hypothetical protein
MLRDRIPGYQSVYRIYLLATALGVVIHETAHAEMVEDLGFEVHEICRFQMANPAGYVIHDEPVDYLPCFAISTAPFLLNSAFSFTAFTLSAIILEENALSSLKLEQAILVLGLLWIGFASGVHAFPSRTDAMNIWDATKRNWWNPVAILGIPVLAVLLLVSKLERWGAAIFYTGGIAILAHYVTDTILIA